MDEHPPRLEPCPLEDNASPVSGEHARPSPVLSSTQIQAWIEEPIPAPSITHSEPPPTRIDDSESASGNHLRQHTPASLLLSTGLSLSVVLILLATLRWMLPSLLEFSRYSWHRGQLKAEYEMAGQQLERVSWDGLNSISQTVARRVSPSVVHITMSSNQSINPEMNTADLRMPNLLGNGNLKVGQGSGVIVDSQGYILTNFHVLDEGEKISVVLADDRTCEAELIGFDKLTDLAVLKIRADDILPIKWGDSDCMDVGAPVWAVGSPFGLTGSITFGILSSKHRLDLRGTSYEESLRDPRRKKKKPEPRYSDLMQSDVAVNPGNSGGPLVNGKGELIGINTAIIGESYRGVSFSIPSNVAKLVYHQILETGKMRRGWLGVELVRVDDWRKWQNLVAEPSATTPAEPETVAVENPALPEARVPTRGATIKTIVPDSPAANANFQVGDTILEINGKAVKGVDDLIFTIGKTSVDSPVQFLVEREGKKFQVEVIIGERPDLSQ